MVKCCLSDIQFVILGTTIAAMDVMRLLNNALIYTKKEINDSTILRSARRFKPNLFTTGSIDG